MSHFASCPSPEERTCKKLMAETKKQVRKETRMLERTKVALIKEIREGAKKLRLLDEMKRLRHKKEKRIE